MRQSLRKKIRSIRQSLDKNAVKDSGKKLVDQVLSLSQLPHSKNIGLFLSFDNEIETRPLINALWKLNKNIYLPVIHPFCKGRLLFLNYAQSTPLIKNKYNIDEPKLDVTKVIPLTELDILFVPLVAFDGSNNRLGMGGGYYDRTLANQDSIKPIPIGLAYDFQKVEQLPIESWDIPLPLIITPTNHLYKE